MTETNEKLTALRAEMVEELEAIEYRLGQARDQRDRLNEQIKKMVAERDEVRATVKRLTPRAPKNTVTPPNDDGAK